MASNQELGRASQRSIGRLPGKTGCNGWFRYSEQDCNTLGPQTFANFSPSFTSLGFRLLPSLVYLRRRENYWRNISASNAARLIRKVRCNIRNYDTHFSRTGRNNEEKTAQLVTMYCAINGTARLRAMCARTCVCVYVFALYRYRPRNFRFIWKLCVLRASFVSYD